MRFIGNHVFYAHDRKSGCVSATSHTSLRPGIQPQTVTTQADLDFAAGRSRTAPTPTRVGVLAPVLYPNVEDVRRGDRLQLAAGEERAVTLQVEEVLPAHVTGTIVGPDGQPFPNVGGQVFLNDPAMPRMGLALRSFSSDASGAFTVESLMPGRYMFATRSSGSPIGDRSRPRRHCESRRACPVTLGAWRVTPGGMNAVSWTE